MPCVLVYDRGHMCVTAPVWTEVQRGCQGTHEFGTLPFAVVSVPLSLPYNRMRLSHVASVQTPASARIEARVNRRVRFCDLGCVMLSLQIGGTALALPSTRCYFPAHAMIALDGATSLAPKSAQLPQNSSRLASTQTLTQTHQQI